MTAHKLGASTRKVKYQPTPTMQTQPILIPSLRRANFPAWVTAIRLKAGALGLTTALDDAKLTADLILVLTLAFFTNAILDSIPIHAQTEATHGNPDLHLYRLLRAIQSKFNPTSPVDHEALEVKVSRMLLRKYDTIEEYFEAHRKIRSQMLSAGYPAIEKVRTSIKCIISGVSDHPDFQYVLTPWTSQPPATIQDLLSMAISA